MTYYRWTVASPSHTLKTNTQSDGICRCAFGKWLGHADEALMNGISALLEETRELALSLFPPHKDTSSIVCNPEESPQQNYIGILI